MITATDLCRMLNIMPHMLICQSHTQGACIGNMIQHQRCEEVKVCLVLAAAKYAYASTGDATRIWGKNASTGISSLVLHEIPRPEKIQK